MGQDRFGREVYRPGQYLIVLQEDRCAYRVARVERVNYATKRRAGGGYVVRFWRWASGRWSGETLVQRSQILGRHVGGQQTIEEVSSNLQAYANMRAAAIRTADEDMLAATCGRLGLSPFEPPRSRVASVARRQQQASAACQ